jgi:ABC-type phosphate/phosphonate transport system permease subunit
MRSGEHRLAIAPFCGTNLAAMGTLAGLAGALAMWDVGKRLRDKLERLPMAISLATVATVFALPLGVLLQERVTTSGQPGALQVAQITRTQQRGVPVHRVLVRG